MKTLTLLRHAKSGWDDVGVRDFDRPLNAKGRRAATTVGRHLRQAGAGFDHVVASPARRVLETLEEVAGGFGAALDPHFDRRIYLASAATLVEVLREFDDDVGSALLVGHNPGLEELVLLLVPDTGTERLRDDVETKFPTASVAVLHLAIDHWADLTSGSATLARFTRPRDLDPQLGPGVD